MGDPEFDKMTPEQIMEYQMQNCIFCKIVKGEIPARKIFENDLILCIMDIYPAAKGHLIVLPKKHYPFLPAIPREISSNLFKLTGEISKALKSAVVAGSSTIFIANGAIAGQQSPHFLMHIIPREIGDGLDNFNVPMREIPQNELLDFASKFKNKIGISEKPNSNKNNLINEKVISEISEKPNADENEIRIPGGSNERFSYLANMILENPQLKKLMQDDPSGFLKELKKYPDVEKLFDGIDVVKLANALKSIKSEK